MISEPLSKADHAATNIDFDACMAQLMILLTHHSLTRCPNALQPIIERLEHLFRSGDLDFFPEQREVLVKMHKLWLLEQARCEQKH